MSYLLKVLSLLSLVLSLAGCAGVISYPRDDVPVEDISGPRQEGEVDEVGPMARSGEDISSAEILMRESTTSGTTQAPERPAVLALMQAAEEEEASGDAKLAAASIERALRLEPKNAVLWTRLAEIRLAERNWHQAYVLANKSNSLAQGNRQVQLRNWQIIAEARDAMGDTAGAEEARVRIQGLR